MYVWDVPGCSKYHIAGKVDRKLKYGSLAVGVETAKSESTNIVFARNMYNDVMHA